MAETIFWWIFVLACVFAFFLCYGMIEDLISQGLRARRSRKAGESPPPASPLRVHEHGGNGHGDASLLH